MHCYPIVGRGTRITQVSRKKSKPDTGVRDFGVGVRPLAVRRRTDQRLSRRVLRYKRAASPRVTVGGRPGCAALMTRGIDPNVLAERSVSVPPVSASERLRR